MADRLVLAALAELLDIVFDLYPADLIAISSFKFKFLVTAYIDDLVKRRQTHWSQDMN